MRRVRPGQAQSSPAGSGVEAPRAEAKGRDSWGRGRDAKHAGPALGAGPRGRRKGGTLGGGAGRKARRPGYGGGAPGERQKGGTLGDGDRAGAQGTPARLWGRGPEGGGKGVGRSGGGAELSSTQVAWTIPSRSGRTSVSAWLRRRPLAEPPSEPRPRPSAGSRPFPSGSTLLAEALSRIFITMPSAPGSSQVIRTVQSTEQRYTCQLTFPAAL